MKFYNQQLSKLESSLARLELGTANTYERAEKAIKLCRETLSSMREWAQLKGFKNRQEECSFFKTVKPQVVGNLIHFVNLVHIARYSPMGCWKAKHKFYLEYISKLRKYFTEHHEIYDYYIRNLSHLDAEYFSRNKLPIELHSDSITAMMDIEFATAKDMIFAQFIGNTFTINYLKNKVLGRRRASLSIKQTKSPLQWTDAKVDLVELIYALHTSGSINHGRADLKDIAKAFEIIMQIEIGDYYRTFLEIRNRKMRPTKFLDFLKSSLERRMMEADG